MKNLHQTILVVIATLLTIMNVSLVTKTIELQDSKERIIYYYQCRELSGGLALKSVYQDSIDSVILDWCGDGNK